jgi:hypothetical protein
VIVDTGTSLVIARLDISAGLSERSDYDLILKEILVKVTWPVCADNLGALSPISQTGEAVRW